MSSRQQGTTRRRGAATRDQLVETGLQLLEEGGPEALQARRVAAAAGASSMTVYTHFGGMTGLLEALAAEAFTRFGAALAGTAHTDDPIADFFAMGYAYHSYALAAPQRYRLMFGLTAQQAQHPLDRDFTAAPVSDAVGAETFEHLVGAVQRMIDGGQLHPDSARPVAARLWALMHGAVMLEVSGYLGPEGNGVATVLVPATVDLLVGMGADRAEVEQSLQRAIEMITGSQP
ncbi:TetR/AcrR family transcriptional regulator [Nocardia mexicana]|uniref:TetR family transcriptional regulator n=1 Tax=Nocardia mexicana TaxID=279262 RepID=A0A370H3C4_9NOCA|nr:TetR-like C-terminal domain-containing protein [Nocardia mexicana]RDI50715.1 TetR family transcriptional regulator [Nocardia mexicana]